MTAVRIEGRLHCKGKPMPAGPWHDEPDHVEFTHLGVPCILHRGPAGAWCGYVAVAAGHPWFERGAWFESDKSKVIDPQPEVHWGVSYAAHAPGVEGVANGPLWWVGFDCSHYGDVRPYDQATDDDWEMMRDRESTYKTVDFARRHTERLAVQAAQADVRANRDYGDEDMRQAVST